MQGDRKFKNHINLTTSIKTSNLDYRQWDFLNWNRRKKGHCPFEDLQHNFLYSKVSPVYDPWLGLQDFLVCLFSKSSTKHVRNSTLSSPFPNLYLQLRFPLGWVIQTGWVDALICERVAAPYRATSLFNLGFHSTSQEPGGLVISPIISLHPIPWPHIFPGLEINP